MIYRRVAAKLRAQDWFAISIELAIVVIGVFIGTWVANRNQDAAERRQAQQMLAELRPGLSNFGQSLASAQTYFAVASNYGDTAFAGWAGSPKVSDKAFVIAAYQASQITQIALNGGSWTQIYGGSQLSRLPDPELRRDLAWVMSLDFGQLGMASTATPYRQHVREVIPEDIQDAIRSKCGDYIPEGQGIITLLPATCDVDFPAPRWTAAARDLRADPQLVKELRWHRAAVASFTFIVGIFKNRVNRTLDRIDFDARGGQ